MRIRKTAILLIISGITACTGALDARDDVAVLHAVLEKACGNEATGPTLISNIPATYRNYSLPPDWSRSPEYDRLLSRYGARATHWDPGEICQNARIVPKSEIDATFAEDIRVPPGWEKFYATFNGAHGYFAYSRPIYSNDGKHALVFSDWHCEGLCGMGMVLELERTHGHWRVLHVAGTWIS